MTTMPALNLKEAGLPIISQETVEDVGQAGKLKAGVFPWPDQLSPDDQITDGDSTALLNYDSGLCLFIGRHFLS